jgi:hypothetical protein
MAREPSPHGGMLVGGVVVEDRVECLAGGNLALDGVEEADELLMLVALHVAADHGSVERVHRGEQHGRPVPFFCADLQMAHVSKGLNSNSNIATSTYGVLFGYLVGDREI